MPARLVLGTAVAVLTIASSAVPAWAHGGEESHEAGDLVRQAVALIVNKPSDRMAIEDKINDALDASDKHGVDLALVSQAKTAFDHDDLRQVRILLEESIGARPFLRNGTPAPIREVSSGPATGSETGTNVAIDALRVRRHFNGRMTVALVLSLLAIVAGVALSLRYRPDRSYRGPKEPA